MKNSKKLKLIIIIITVPFIIISFFAYVVTSMFMSIPRSQIDHYLDDSNYEEVSAQLIIKRENILIFETSDKRLLSIWECCEQIVADKGFNQIINLGDTVLATSTTGYFWDDYDQPIVSLTFNETKYLDFEDGKSNLIDYLENARKLYLQVTIPILVIGGIALTALILSLILLKKNNKKSFIKYN